MYYTKPELHHRRRRSVVAHQQPAQFSWHLLLKWGFTRRVFLASFVGLLFVVIQIHYKDLGATENVPTIYDEPKLKIHYQTLGATDNVPTIYDEPKLVLEHHSEQSNNSSFKISSSQTRNVVKASSLFGMERVDRSKRLEFVHITKTGGSAIEMGAAAAGMQWGACHYVEIPYLGCNRTADWESPLKVKMPDELKNKTHSEPWHSPPHWLVPNPHPKNRVANFLVVRDPYHRIFSEFYCSAFGYNGTVNVKSLNEWIMGKLTEETPYYGHLLPQHYYVFHHKTGAQIVDHVLRYETLGREFKLLMKLYHLNVKMPQKKSAHFVMSVEQSASRLTVADLTLKTLRIINEYYRRDFESFGYDMIVSD